MAVGDWQQLVHRSHQRDERRQHQRRLRTASRRLVGERLPGASQHERGVSRPAIGARRPLCPGRRRRSRSSAARCEIGQAGEYRKSPGRRLSDDCRSSSTADVRRVRSRTIPSSAPHQSGPVRCRCGPNCRPVGSGFRCDARPLRVLPFQNMLEPHSAQKARWRCGSSRVAIQQARHPRRVVVLRCCERARVAAPAAALVQWQSTTSRAPTHPCHVAAEAAARRASLGHD
jgi:hypothetical protein